MTDAGSGVIVALMATLRQKTSLRITSYEFELFHARATYFGLDNSTWIRMLARHASGLPAMTAPALTEPPVPAPQGEAATAQTTRFTFRLPDEEREAFDAFARERHTMMYIWLRNLARVDVGLPPMDDE